MCKLPDSSVKNLKDFRSEHCSAEYCDKVKTGRKILDNVLKSVVTGKISAITRMVVANTGHQELRVETVSFLLFPEVLEPS